MTKNISSVRSLQKLKQRSCYLSKGVINGIAAAGIAIIMFIQGKLLLNSHINNSPQKEDNAPQHNFRITTTTPSLKHDLYNISQLTTWVMESQSIHRHEFRYQSKEDYHCSFTLQQATTLDARLHWIICHNKDIYN